MPSGNFQGNKILIYVFINSCGMINHIILISLPFFFFFFLFIFGLFADLAICPIMMKASLTYMCGTLITKKQDEKI